ncbi:hypothetical protein [Brevibacillus fortis]
MGKYGDAAVLAVKLIESNQASTPQMLGEQASTEEFFARTH